MHINALLHWLGLDSNQFEQNSDTGRITIKESSLTTIIDRLDSLETNQGNNTGGGDVTTQQLNDAISSLTSTINDNSDDIQTNADSIIALEALINSNNSGNNGGSNPPGTSANLPPIRTTKYDNAALPNIPPSLAGNEFFDDSVTGMRIVRLPWTGTSVDSSKPPLSKNNQYAYLPDGNGTILDVSDPTNITVKRSSSSLGAQSTWHPLISDYRYGKASNLLQMHDIESNALSAVRDTNNNTIPMGTLGQGKGTVALGGLAIPISDSAKTELKIYLINDQTNIATLQGVIDLTIFDGFNGARISKDGLFVIITNDSSSDEEGLYLYRTDGSAVITGVDNGLGTNNIVPYTDNRSQHAAWGVEDDYGNPVVLVSESIAPHAYDVVRDETLAIPFDETLNNGNGQRFGNGFACGHNYDLDGWAFFASDEFNSENGGTRRNIVSARLSRIPGVTHIIPKSGDNVMGIKTVPDHRLWCTSGGGGTSGSRVAASYDASIVTFTSNISGVNAPYLAYLP